MGRPVHSRTYRVTSPNGKNRVPAGTRLCQIRMAFRDEVTCETYGLRYARPDPERRADALSASQSVLKAHRYR
ncbi:hypothetical protein MPL1032_140102 [Mesorhizobium plurifarium]|uniref:Uncharacterized protein n=1 Tax=Mesorhizobium plurifarium TaxID=69974 RepID=A0A0K2VRG5_MESPL|nr:hypothetical protein MPL1032_140102 [Mesorhizobium plurifarium]